MITIQYCVDYNESSREMVVATIGSKYSYLLYEFESMVATLNKQVNGVGWSARVNTHSNHDIYMVVEHIDLPYIHCHSMYYSFYDNTVRFTYSQHKNSEKLVDYTRYADWTIPSRKVVREKLYKFMFN